MLGGAPVGGALSPSQATNIRAAASIPGQETVNRMASRQVQDLEQGLEDQKLISPESRETLSQVTKRSSSLSDPAANELAKQKLQVNKTKSVTLKNLFLHQTIY